MLADSPIGSLVCGLLLCASGVVLAAAEEPPDIEFLEYLGMWEESDEEWLLLEESMAAETEERNDPAPEGPAPEGEESTEKDDESEKQSR